MNPKLSISFKKDYLKAYQWLQSKDNISSYVCKLVLADMSNEQHSPDIEAKIKTILAKMLKNGDFGDGINLNLEDKVSLSESLSMEDKNLINSLF